MLGWLVDGFGNEWKWQTGQIISQSEDEVGAGRFAVSIGSRTSAELADAGALVYLSSVLECRPGIDRKEREGGRLPEAGLPSV